MQANRNRNLRSGSDLARRKGARQRGHSTTTLIKGVWVVRVPAEATKSLSALPWCSKSRIADNNVFNSQLPFAKSTLFRGQWLGIPKFNLVVANLVFAFF